MSEVMESAWVAVTNESLYSLLITLDKLSRAAGNPGVRFAKYDLLVDELAHPKRFDLTWWIGWHPGVPQRHEPAQIDLSSLERAFLDPVFRNMVTIALDIHDEHMVEFTTEVPRLVEIYQSTLPKR